MYSNVCALLPTSAKPDFLNELVDAFLMGAEATLKVQVSIGGEEGALA